MYGCSAACVPLMAAFFTEWPLVTKKGRFMTTVNYHVNNLIMMSPPKHFPKPKSITFLSETNNITWLIVGSDPLRLKSCVLTKFNFSTVTISRIHIYLLNRPLTL